MNTITKRITLALWALFAVIQLSAQTGFGINPVFDGKLVPSSRIKETFIDGSQLAPYKLRIFRSVKFTSTADELSRIQTLLLQDGKRAEDRQTEYAGGVLTYALFRFRAEGRSIRSNVSAKGNKYLCMQVFPKGEQYDITLVYMSGDATLADLKKLFSN
ncbi:MAG: hypothetical protein IJP49_01690 [Bacteroidales bacterium]|nr:hypothetical protein [Bacteroidales bacterium]